MFNVNLTEFNVNCSKREDGIDSYKHLLNAHRKGDILQLTIKNIRATCTNEVTI